MGRSRPGGFSCDRTQLVEHLAFGFSWERATQLQLIIFNFELGVRVVSIISASAHVPPCQTPWEQMAEANLSLAWSPRCLIRMSTLPPELVDEILIHLRHDKKALCHCSLVAKSWTYSSQKLLYARVHITPSAYQTRQEIASPTSTELLQHVHSLTCHQFQSLHELHKDYLKSFHRLQRLTLDGVDGVDSDVVNLFPAFQNTLSSLSLFAYPSLWTRLSTSSAISPISESSNSVDPPSTQIIGQSLPLPHRHAGSYVSPCSRRKTRVPYFEGSVGWSWSMMN